MRKFLTGIAALLCLLANGQNIQAGNYFGKVQNGLALIMEDRSAVNLRFGWYEGGNYENFYDNLTEETYYKGPHTPDQDYVESYWLTDGRKITLKWGLYEDEILGYFEVSDKVRLVIEALPAWDGFEMVYSLEEESFFSNSATDSYRIEFSDAPKFVLEGSDEIVLVNSLKEGKLDNTSVKDANCAALIFDIEPGKPLFFSSKNRSESDILNFLRSAKENYEKTRLTAKGAWEDFASPILNNVQHSRAYNYKNRCLTTVVSHKWTQYGGQRIFEWDTFFNGLLASLEDTLTAKEDFRGILNYQQPNGMVPNVASPIGEISTDRSQPPVGALCVWKYFNHTADTTFLREVFYKLYDWNRWWFKINPETGLPYRDGNQNGLLEWGTSDKSDLDLGKLQLAKYESGQDNSPMFDNVIFNSDSYTMELDMVGLSSLWAADAVYLSKIARVLGYFDHENLLLNDAKKVVEKIENNLWDSDQNRYADRYWEGKSKKPAVDLSKKIPEYWFSSENGKPNLVKKEFAGDKLVKSGNVSSIAHDPKEAIDKVVWEGEFQVSQTDEYFFYSPDENGVRLFINDQKLFDNRKMWITEFTSQAAPLKEGEKYSFRLIYEGKEGFDLKYARTKWNDNQELFSSTFSINSFYPLMTGLIRTNRADTMLRHLTDTTKFWGEYITPTVSRQDPAFEKQGYWRGRIWPPTNYLLFQGLIKYASSDLTTNYARKSVQLFMKSWNKNWECYENWYATTGEGSGFPHYTWGALNLLIGLENFIRVGEEDIWLENKASEEGVSIYNFPVMGKNRNFESN